MDKKLFTICLGSVLGVLGGLTSLIALNFLSGIASAVVCIVGVYAFAMGMVVWYDHIVDVLKDEDWDLFDE